ncbi:acyl-ACP desaturase [Tuwongella immobilis]|uniref:Acyl-ACP desaturase n=1 Tax=Tuwongella immobilis TaxID=692036 RepID=A0A6C2YT46_9BACT|nr:acyl-ACP desaturase [Tuwongella immobilis]VIP04095.1 acyl-acp desaturase : Probable Acyl-[acyl-carrier protein] desaturase OS=Sorangium cellulosum (strain So ce56) GN=sce2527 PE=4 SV=1: FA_desaturase_2 [Tuwongella immobilis]VTS05557.1 acyl-acp desaturase : Probable Acyl-[acyl-carrier protein] desaturase OS=Sorangium cellulosum (strain So ce56) GN=sce2527 PE=4 SV=1: FA_desaturase_2 [Tuwongella immobilis]
MNSADHGSDAVDQPSTSAVPTPTNGVHSPNGSVLGAPSRGLDTSGLEEAYYRLYREFFRRAERRRRWSVDEDIPWESANPNLAPEVADVVESFCAVELYLPDYIAKAIPLARSSRGRVWFHANWGYEESKHSMALGDWLLKSGQRSEEQLADLESGLYQHQWNLPRESPLGMVVYGMAQELATWLHYRNLRNRLDSLGGDPALDKLLGFIATDERAHYDFYRQIVLMYLERDRASTIAELRQVLHDFSMPAVYLLTQSQQRRANIQSLNIFDEQIYYQEVYTPLLAALKIDRQEMRKPRIVRTSV